MKALSVCRDARYRCLDGSRPPVPDCTPGKYVVNGSKPPIPDCTGMVNFLHFLTMILSRQFDVTLIRHQSTCWDHIGLFGAKFWSMFKDANWAGSLFV